jgi:hypothetical protein
LATARRLCSSDAVIRLSEIRCKKIMADMVMFPL